jgi:hypothetical protein
MLNRIIITVVVLTIVGFEIKVTGFGYCNFVEEATT